jgi:hypothetical protein
MASSDSVGFGWMLAIRVAQHHLNDAVFRRESFLCVRLVVTRLSPVTNSLRPSAGGACPSTADSDIPCRSHGAAPRLPPLGSTQSPRERRPLFRTRQDRFTARRLELTTSRPRMPSIGLIPTLSGWESLRVEKFNPLLAAGAPLPPARRFPPVKVMGRRLGLAPAVPPGRDALRRPDRRPDEDRIPLPKSLQPTCYQRAPLVPTYSRARGSHLADLLFGARPSPNTLVLSWDRALRIGAGWPEGISDPEWRRNWRRVRQPWLFSRASRRTLDSSSPRLVDPGAASPFSLRGVNPRAGVVFRCAGRTMRPRTLHVALLFRGPLVGELEEKSQGPFSQTAHQCRRFPGPKRLPPMSPFRPVPCWRKGRDFRAATGPLAWPPWSSFRHAFARTGTS